MSFFPNNVGRMSFSSSGGSGWGVRKPAGSVWVVKDGDYVYAIRESDGVTVRLWKMGVFDFTPAPIDSSAPVGSLIGTFTVGSPDGSPTTVTVTDPGYTVSGNGLLTAIPIRSGDYLFTAKVTDTHGWVWSKMFGFSVDEAIVLTDATFSQPLYAEVPVPADTVLNGIADGATAVSNISGVTFDDSVRPVTVSGTPAAAGIVANAVVQTLGAATKITSYEVLPGIPVNTSLPLATAIPQVGVPYGSLPAAGQVLGPDDGTFTNNPTSRSVQHMLVASGTGNGVAIDKALGGAQPQYIPQPSDIGKRLRRRIRAHNPAGSSTAPGTYSDLSPPVIAAASTQPVNTAAPTLSSQMGAHSGLDDVITATPGVWTGAGGGVVGGFYAGDDPIEGETPLTFRRTMTTLTASITYREVATGPGGAQTSVSSTAIVGDPGLKTWLKALIDPVMPTVGAGTFTTTIDDDLDLLLAAGQNVSTAIRTKPIKINGGRRRRAVGLNMGANQLGMFKGEIWQAEGCVFDGTGKPESDGFSFGGSFTRGADNVHLLNCRGTGGWGTANAYRWQGQDNKAAITSFLRVAPNEWILTLAAPFPEPVTPGTPGGNTVVNGRTRKIRISGMPGYGPLEGPHFDYISIQIIDATHWRLKLTDFADQYFDDLPRPAVGVLLTGGTAWFMWHQAGAPASADSAEHNDTLPGQHAGDGPIDQILCERCSIDTAYQAGILGIKGSSPIRPTPEFIDCDFRPDMSRDPQEINTLFLYMYKLAGLKATNTWMKARFDRAVRASSLFWSKVTNSQSNREWTETIDAQGRKCVTTDGMEGCFYDGEVEDRFCTHASGSTYVSPGSLGYAGPDISRFSAITLEKGSGADVAAGILDRIVVDYDGPEIIDTTITGISDTILKKGPGPRIVTGQDYVPGTPYTFTVNATVRGSGVVKSQTLTRGA